MGPANKEEAREKEGDDDVYHISSWTSYCMALSELYLVSTSVSYMRITHKGKICHVFTGLQAMFSSATKPKLVVLSTGMHMNSGSE